MAYRGHIGPANTHNPNSSPNSNPPASTTNNPPASRYYTLTPQERDTLLAKIAADRALIRRLDSAVPTLYEGSYYSVANQPYLMHYQERRDASWRIRMNETRLELAGVPKQDWERVLETVVSIY